MGLCRTVSDSQVHSWIAQVRWVQLGTIGEACRKFSRQHCFQPPKSCVTFAWLPRAHPTQQYTKPISNPGSFLLHSFLGKGLGSRTLLPWFKSLGFWRLRKVRIRISTQYVRTSIGQLSRGLSEMDGRGRRSLVTTLACDVIGRWDVLRRVGVWSAKFC